MRLTRCLLRYGGFNCRLSNFLTCPCILDQQQKKSLYTHGGTRTPNLRFRRPTPYPLGHAGTVGAKWFETRTHGWQKQSHSKKFCVARESNPGRKNGNLAWYHYTSDAMTFHQISVENHKPFKLVWFSPALHHVWRSDVGIVPHRIFVLSKYSPASSVGRAWDS